MTLLDDRPDAIDRLIRAGKTYDLAMNWEDSLAGRTFTSTLDDEALVVDVVGDVMTVTASAAITGALTTGVEVQWQLLEEIDGAPEPILLGTWTPDDGPRAGTSSTVTVAAGASQVTVTVPGAGAVAALDTRVTTAEADIDDLEAADTAHFADDTAHGDPLAQLATHAALTTAHGNPLGALSTHTADNTAHGNPAAALASHAADNTAHGNPLAALATHVADLTAHGDPMAELRTPTPVARDTFVPLLRGAPDPARWTRYLLTPGTGNSPDSALTFEHGQLVIRVVGGNGLTSERHELWAAPDVPASPYGRIRSRWAAWPPTDGIVQHVHAHRIQDQGGKIRSIVLWDGIFGSPIGGVWEANSNGTGFVSAPATIVDQDTISAASRDAAGLVTATVPAGATSRWRVGDAVRVDLADNTYDGSFILSSVTSTQVQWTQTNGGLDASGGTGTMQQLGHHFTNFSVMTNNVWSFTGASRTNGIVTTTGLPAGHPLQIGDRVVVDAATASYDGRRVISDVNQTTNQVSWIDNQANDATAGAGTITKNTPTWCETQVLPGTTGGDILQARFWPDKGLDLNGGTPGPMLGGPPSWEQHGWTLTYDLSTVTGAAVPDIGLFGVGAAHHSSNSPLRFDGIEITPLHVASGI